MIKTNNKIMNYICKSIHRVFRWYGNNRYREKKSFKQTTTVVDIYMKCGADNVYK